MSSLDVYIRVLKYPVLAQIIADSSYTLAAYVLPPMGSIPSLVVYFMILQIPFGAWVGYKIVELKGNFLDVIIVGLILGVVCGVLDLTETGVIVSAVGTYNAIDELPYSLAYVLSTLYGAIVAGGYALTK
jgi:hypothetical protein